MKKIFLTIAICFALFSPVHAETIKDKLTVAYNNFYTKLEAKYGKEKQLEVLEGIETKLNTYLSSGKLSEAKKELLRYLFALNAQKIESIKTGSKKTHFVEQKEKELRYIFPLKNLGSSTKVPSYITDLTSLGKTLIFVTDDYEFVDGGKIKKYVFDRYYAIDSGNVSAFSSKAGVILKTSGSSSYFFIENYTLQEKIPYSQFYSEEFETQFVEDQAKYILGTDDVYYTFIFTNYSVFSDEYGVYDSNFASLGIDKDNVVFYRDDEGRFGFVKDFKKVKLISKDILEGVVNTDAFLQNLSDDKKWLQADTDKDFSALKAVVKAQTKSAQSDSAKISAVYHWILDNISYSKTIDFNDRKIFSGILTFTNKEGVCDGYTKLMLYMLLFAGVSDTQTIKGDVIDAQDFPQIGHAWVKVGQDYYDPTFDDPIGASGTLTKEQYKYFNLPKELFYTNRYDYGDTPEYMTTLSLEERKNIVRKNIFDLIGNYTDRNFLLLAPLKFRAKYKLKYDEQITTTNISKILPYYEVKSDFSFTMDGKKKFITYLQYYSIDADSDLEVILSQHNYDISGLYFFRWQLDNGTYVDRVGYDVKY